MKYDELAFVNQQLATMLREGIPLEGGLRQLCATMQRGRMRRELELLETDLAAGVPLAQAAAKRTLPEFYGQMLQIGARSHDLPGLLTLLADYYQNANLVWTRLKGLMVYPAIVLTLSAAFSIWTATLFGKFAHMLGVDSANSIVKFMMLGSIPRNRPIEPFTSGVWYLWAPAFLLVALALPALAMAALPGLRREFQWRLPAFHEASLARAASTMAILLKAGCSLSEALGLLQKMEAGTAAATELARWQSRGADGHGKFTDVAADSKIFPPMFVWLVAGAGENLAAGFERAAQVYNARAAYRSNVMLYAALPSSLLFLGLVIMAQMFPLAQLIFRLPWLLSR